MMANLSGRKRQLKIDYVERLNKQGKSRGDAPATTRQSSPHDLDSEPAGATQSAIPARPAAAKINLATSGRVL
jgi:hypothetical protein